MTISLSTSVLSGDVIERVPKLGYRAAYVKQHLRDRLLEHAADIRRCGEDLPEVRYWTWSASGEAR